MRISAIIKIALNYFLLGIIGLAFVSILFVIGYFLIYRKLLKGTKTLKIKQFILYEILLIYIIVVLGATLGIRHPMNHTNINAHLFSSYNEAWNSFSSSEWRNIILNIMMFVPLGFLIPLMSKRFQTWWITYLVGLFSTILLELIQLVTGRGIFELDDIFNNTLGCMIGYGIVMIFISFFSDKEKQLKNKGLILTCLQIPLCIAIVAFSIIFINYAKQELGNLSQAYSYKQDISNINITTKVKFDTQPKKAYVYKTIIGTKEDTLKIANKIFSIVNAEIDESQNDIYDNTIIYHSKNKNYSVWVDYLGLTTWYNDSTQVKYKEKEGLTYKEVKDLLGMFDIKLPEKIYFTEKGKGSYNVSVNMVNMGAAFIDGELTCTINDTNTISNFKNNIISYTPYKEYEIISEQEAYDIILQGKFKLYSLEQRHKIEIKDVRLIYKIDSKGFKQPVYEFILDDTSMDKSILIPALKL